ncbi:hypothetical protein [Chondrinema litorale]|uniref:hypothetical protein n=1 Tax=Chondrinema litorale TaxID=2994555 RepID=UPI00254319D9|nr:hypothetical protein [Chondrinema litorale]UZR98264.1 hypothetical protein OQ292_31005 [Chondrinema litorale]
MRNYIITVFIFFAIDSAHAQNNQFSFGPKFGIYGQQRFGSALCDSIVIETQTSSFGNPFIGLFADYKLTNGLSTRIDINYFSKYVGLTLYNKEEISRFGSPLKKTGLITTRTIDLQISASFIILKRTQFFAGISPNFNFALNTPYIDVDERFHPGLNDVINYLDKTPKNFTLHYNAGIRVDI